MFTIGVTAFLAVFCFYVGYLFKQRERRNEAIQLIQGTDKFEYNREKGFIKNASTFLKQSFSFLFPKNEGLVLIEEMLRHAGIRRFTAEDIVTIRILAFAGAFFAINVMSLFSLKGVMMGLLAGMSCYLFINIRIRGMIKNREIQIDKEILLFIETVYSCVRSGRSLPNAINEVAFRTQGTTLSQIFREMVRRMDSGYSFQESMKEVQKESNSRNLNMFIDFIVQTNRYGVEIGPLLSSQLDSVRHEIEQQGMTKAQVKGANIVLPNIFFMAVPSIGMLVLPMFISGASFLNF